MSKGHFRIISNVSFRKTYIGQRIESETDRECKLSTETEANHFDKLFLMAPHLL